MRKLLPALLLFFSTAVNAQVITTPNEKVCFPAVNWTSRNANDTVTIHNGAGFPILIVITVNPSTEPTPAGITVSNCGTTTTIAAGSSAVCTTNDANNPVNFRSDSPNTPVTGTYQIKQQ